jgi:carboxypeptidase Q
MLVAGTRYARSILQEILSMLSAINTTTVLEGTIDDIGPDTTFFVEAGVPGVELYSANENYFHYHHTEGES